MNYRIFLLLFYILQVSAKRNSKLFGHDCNICQHGGSDAHLVSTHPCKRPAAPYGGYIRCTYDSTFMKCKGQCSSGYKFPDGKTEIEIQCSSRDAVWYPIRNFPDCVSQNYRPYDQTTDNLNDHSVALSRCKRPNPPTNGEIRCSYDSENVFCTGKCNQGYYFPDGQPELQLQCNLIRASWYPTSIFPDCVWIPSFRADPGGLELTAKRCRRPQSPALGQISCAYDDFKMECRGTCYSGYTFPNGRTEMVLQCNTRKAYWYPEERFPNCVSGDYGKDVQTTSNGNEEKNSFAVTLIRCRKPASPEPGISHCEYDSVGMNCTGSCTAGYYFPNGKREMVLQCRTENGIWIPRREYPACSQIDNERLVDNTEQQQQHVNQLLQVTLVKCGRIDAPAGGSVNCKYDSVGMNCTGTCRDGYYFPERRPEIILYCKTTNGVWHPVNEFPSCSPYDYNRPTSENQRYNSLEVTLNRCRRKGAPINGYSNCEYDARGMNCTGTCRAGFYFPGRKTEVVLRCQTENAVWYPQNEFPSCLQFEDGYTDNTEQQLQVTLRRCGTKRAPAGGYSNCKYDSLGTNCTGTCFEGYYFPRKQSEIVLRCRTVNAVWYPQSEFPSCSQENDGYREVSSQNEQVTLIRCGKKQAPANGYVNCRHDINGMNCTGTCARNYYFPGRRMETVLYCRTEDGVWYPRTEFPSCTRYDYDDVHTSLPDKEKNTYSVTLAKCRKPDAPEHGISNCNYNERGMNCTGTCNTGYYFPNGREGIVLQCRTENGIWFPQREYPSCSQTDNEKYTGQQQQKEDLNSQIIVTLNKCGRKQAPLHGYVECKYNAFGINCTGTCRSDFYFPGKRTEVVLRCRTLDGIWYPRTEFPLCSYDEKENFEDSTAQVEFDKSTLLQVTLDQCGKRAAPSSGYVYCRHDIQGMNCTGTCRRGYSFPDGRRDLILQCRTRDGTWHPQTEFPVCSRIENEVDNPSGGYNDKNEQPSSLSLRETLSRCGRKNAPENGFVNCTYDALGMNCTGTCKINYYFPAERRVIILKCKTYEGIWNPRDEFPPCKIPGYEEIPTSVEGNNPINPIQVTLTMCPKRRPPDAGYVNCKYNAAGMNCTATCLPGYSFPNERQEIITRCTTDTGIWYPRTFFPSCLESEENPRTDDQITLEPEEEDVRLIETLRICGKRIGPELGYVKCDYDALEMNCTGRCRRGYYFPNGKRTMLLQCKTENGIWHPERNFPHCSQPGDSSLGGTTDNERGENLVLESGCANKPDPPATGYLSCVNYSHAIECTGTCMPGYGFTNGDTSMTLLCPFNTGRWTPHRYFPPCYQKGYDLVTDKEDTSRPDEDKPTTNVLCPKPSTPKGGYIHCEEQFSHGYRRCTGTCMSGFSFPDGERSMALRCSIVRGWLPVSSFPSCKETKDRIYRPDDLVTPSTRRPTDENENIDQSGIPVLGLCRRPISIRYGHIYCVQNSANFECTATCVGGYQFPSRENKLIYICDIKSGRWNPRSQFPECIQINERIHRPDLENPPSTRPTNQIENIDQGVHSIYNENDNSHNVETNYDRQTGIQILGLCRRPYSITSGHIYCVQNAASLECTATCIRGYQFSTTESKRIYSCDSRSGRWNPHNQFPECKPVCDVPCNNGGVCVRPNQCFCPQDYRGNFCQYPLSNCDPQNLRFAGSIRCNHTTEETVCSLGCPHGMILEPSYNSLRCNLDGTWIPRTIPRCVEDPRYRNVEENGHLCPNLRCSSSLTNIEGSLCQRPPPPKPGYIRCIYNQLIMECTSKCADGFRFPNGAKEEVRTCDNKSGVWSPREYYTDCEAICDRECQNGGRCVAPNFCFCPVKYRGNYCQYPLSNCDPHRLRFAGSIRCNHTSEETVCQLGCPEGTVLDNPSYGTARCSLEGEWTPPYVPRCVEERPIYHDSRTNHNFREDYTHTTQSNYEQRHEDRLNYEHQTQQQTENLDQHTLNRIKNMSRYEESQKLAHEDQRRFEHRRQTEETSSEDLNNREDRQFRSSELEKESYEQRLKRDQEEKQRRDYERMRELNQQIESTNFDGVHQNNHDYFKDYEKFQRFDRNSDDVHQTRNENSGYAQSFFHQRVNRAESGTYKEHSAQQSSYYRQEFQHTGQHNTEKHTCLLCSTK